MTISVVSSSGPSLSARGPCITTVSGPWSFVRAGGRDEGGQGSVCQQHSNTGALLSLRGYRTARRRLIACHRNSLTEAEGKKGGEELGSVFRVVMGEGRSI